MLLPMILSALGLAAVSDSICRPLDKYVIFKWDDGSTFSRLCNTENTFIYLHGQNLDSSRRGARIYLYISQTLRGGSFSSGSGFEPFLPLSNIELRKCAGWHDYKDVSRVMWVTFSYLEGRFYGDLSALSLSSLKSAKEAAELGAPSEVDPYELAVYNTGQREHSLLTLSQSVFLDTIGLAYKG